MGRGTGARRAVSLGQKSLLSAVDELFPPGTPIPAPSFLTAVTSLLRAQQSSLVVMKLDHDETVLRVLDSTYVNAPPAGEAKFDDGVRNHRAWSSCPLAHRLHRRCVRRPWAKFCYSTLAWANRMHRRGLTSFSLQFLRNMGVKREVSSLLPVDTNIYSLITLYRLDDNARPFSREERRTLAAMHDVFSGRIIDLRARALRLELPVALQATFSLILAGQCEKEIARQTHRSPNTIHDHVKRIYQHFDVSSRGQLMARFVSPHLMSRRSMETSPPA